MDELARMNQEEDDKGGARNAIILAIVVVLVAWYCLTFGLQTLIWIGAKQWAAANSWAGEVPQPLPAASSGASAGSKSTGEEEKAYNYEFRAPWAGKAKQVLSLTGVQLRYDAGQVIVFFDPDAQIDTARALRTPTTPEAQRLANILAGGPIESNYALYQAVYGASPEQLSPTMKGPEALRDNLLLIWKLSFGPDLYSGTAPEFYSFDWGRLRGFQFGDPEKGHPAALRVFDDRDRQFRFIFTVAGDSSGKIAQEEINTAVQSLQVIPISER